MQIKKILAGLPSCPFDDRLYSGLAFESRLKELSSYYETENVYFTPFYVWIEPDRVYEMYEYDLDILFEAEETFEEFAKRYLSVNSLAHLTEDSFKVYNRLKKCKIYTSGMENILPAVQKWVEYILHGEEFRQDFERYFKGFSPENIYFAVY